MMAFCQTHSILLKDHGESHHNVPNSGRNEFMACRMYASFYMPISIWVRHIPKLNPYKQ
eukprot:c17021_g1_i1 orf=353-529(+)